MPFSVNGSNLIVNETQLETSMQPVGNFGVSLINVVIDLLPVILGITAFFLILRFVFRKLR